MPSTVPAPANLSGAGFVPAGKGMLSSVDQDSAERKISAEEMKEQLESLVRDEVFRSSKRSIQFLRYVVEQTIEGCAHQIKERTVGIEVFGRDPSYDTNIDHVVRTAAIEVRKRLAIYYGQDQHRSELRMSLVPGSYIPVFTRPAGESDAKNGNDQTAISLTPLAIAAGPEAKADSAARSRRVRLIRFSAVAAAVGLVGAVIYLAARAPNAQELFWKPVLDSPGAVLIVVGDVPKGPPTLSAPPLDPAGSIPMVHKSTSTSLPFSDAVTLARVAGELRLHGKTVNIRREDVSSFSDLREGPVVLIGAFNNEWSLRLTGQRRYTLALDPTRHLIYIRDAKNPQDRQWSWATDQSPQNQGSVGGPPLEDHALISRIWNSETGHAMIFIGGLYTYGTEAAGEFLADPQRMRAMGATALLKDPHRNVQIVLGTKVTDGTAGPPRVLAVSDE